MDLSESDIFECEWWLSDVTEDYNRGLITTAEHDELKGIITDKMFELKENGE